MSIRLRIAGRGVLFLRAGSLTLLTKQVPVEVLAGAFLEFVISPELRRGIRVQGTLTLKGVQHLKEADSSQRRAIKVMCSILERNIASMSVFTVESAD